ncbi:MULTISPECIES: DUF6191 domain-containing protein [unclassified Streptomyces]|uniref:DUF6191 domain-containing protein n=1 Tax=unclassified Streptomyces TaxID=2593676 RepID=UPI00081F0EDD|nr:DUF6191 domain-containing protein [Streptomyces sp. ScaeMP-e83]MYR96350.1 hypothetical protein [Streptomyces sp. SID4937]SCE07895.1 hypothetical protein GA0115243_1062102 [Streptomyces sp. ScaeMP-e83]
MFNFFEELFAPGRKHGADEQKRLELSRVDVAAGDPGRGPIDLTSGKVTVRAPEAEPDGDGERHMRQAPLEQDAVLAPRTRLVTEPVGGRETWGGGDDGHDGPPER